MASHPINNSLPFVGCPPSKVLLAWGNLLLGPMGWNLRKAEAQSSSITTPRVKGVSDREKEINLSQKEITGQPPPAKRLKVDNLDSPSDPPPPEPPPATSNFEDKEARNEKATKSDDAPVPVELWNDEVARLLGTTVTPKFEIILDKFRIRLVRLWKKRLLRREFCCWYAKKHKLVTTLPVISKSELEASNNWLIGGRSAQTAREELLNKYKAWWTATYRNGSKEKLKDAAGGMDCIQRASETSYWEWNCGSRLFFWRWPPQYFECARDGVPLR
eukprot:scaffold67484_cov35-Attheya_sp.AAC.1